MLYCANYRKAIMKYSVSGTKLLNIPQQALNFLHQNILLQVAGETGGGGVQLTFTTFLGAKIIISQ